jgi:hypothetical protein
LEPHRDFSWLFSAIMVVFRIKPYSPYSSCIRALFALFLYLEIYITLTFECKSNKDNEKTLIEEYLLKWCIYAVFLYKRADRFTVMQFSFLHEGCSVSQFLDKA